MKKRGEQAYKGWIGFDLDGTIAHYEWTGVDHHNIGIPYVSMFNLIRKHQAEGYEIRIFTARVWSPREVITDEDMQRRQYAFEARQAIEKYCMRYFGEKFEVTCEKDFNCIRIYDDLARHVVSNTGRVCCQCEET